MACTKYYANINFVTIGKCFCISSSLYPSNYRMGSNDCCVNRSLRELIDDEEMWREFLIKRVMNLTIRTLIIFMKILVKMFKNATWKDLTTRFLNSFKNLLSHFSLFKHVHVSPLLSELSKHLTIDRVM